MSGVFPPTTTPGLHSLFVVTKRVDGASLFAPSFFLFTTKTTGLSTRMDINLNVCKRKDNITHYVDKSAYIVSKPAHYIVNDQD